MLLMLFFKNCHFQIPLPHIYLCPTYWMNKAKIKSKYPDLSMRLLEHMRAGFLGFNNYKRSYKGDEMEELEEEYAKFIERHNGHRVTE